MATLEVEILELAKQVKETNELARKVLHHAATAVGGNASVKIGGNFGHGVLIGVTMTTCIATWIALIFFAMDVHDLRAWRDIHSTDIGKLKAAVANLEGQRK